MSIGWLSTNTKHQSQPPCKWRILHIPWYGEDKEASPKSRHVNWKCLLLPINPRFLSISNSDQKQSDMWRVLSFTKSIFAFNLCGHLQSLFKLKIGQICLMYPKNQCIECHLNTVEVISLSMLSLNPKRVFLDGFAPPRFKEWFVHVTSLFLGLVLNLASWLFCYAKLAIHSTVCMGTRQIDIDHRG